MPSLQVVEDEEGIEAIAKREVPRFLYPILTSYSGNSKLEHDGGFVIRFCGKTLVSRIYLEHIRRHESVG